MTEVLSLVCMASQKAALRVGGEGWRQHTETLIQTLK